jgi:hypothetical protein
LPLVIIVSSRNCPVKEVGLLKDVQHRLAVLVDLARRDLVAWDRLARRRVDNGDEFAADIERLRKITVAFQLGWHCYALEGGRSVGPLIFPGIEEE